MYVIRHSTIHVFSGHLMAVVADIVNVIPIPPDVLIGKKLWRVDLLYSSKNKLNKANVTNDAWTMT